MTTATISKDFTFSASHQLRGLPDTHPCSRLHGHNYTVRLTLSGTTDPTGFVIDYRDLGWFKDYLDNALDHRHLNDVLDFNPTAENIAAHLVALVDEHHGDEPRLTAISVAVSETPKTWATVTRTTRPRPDPHDLDNDRYRWDFTTDGSTK